MNSNAYLTDALISKLRTEADEVQFSEADNISSGNEVHHTLVTHFGVRSLSEIEHTIISS